MALKRPSVQVRLGPPSFDENGDVVGVSHVLIEVLPVAKRTEENLGYRVLGPPLTPETSPHRFIGDRFSPCVRLAAAKCWPTTAAYRLSDVECG